MVTRELLKHEIDILPDEALVDIQKYIMFQKFSFGIFDSDTEYLNSIPGMAKNIIEGMQEPIDKCLSENEVSW